MSVPSNDPDSRYARGELSREEWLRLRVPSAPGAYPGPSAPAPPPPRKPERRVLLIAAIILVAGLLVAAAFVWSFANSPAAGWNATVGSTRMMSAADLGALNRSATMGMSYTGNNTLWFSGGSVELAVYMSPPDHDMAFVVQGMANPTIHMPAGVRVTVTAVNMDPDAYHDWALSRSGPPYSSMPMMGSGTMMSMTMLSPTSSAGYMAQSMSFTTTSGTYWYLCQYAGHAAAGMYGGFDVG